jgi:hypothetical protein
LPDAEVARRTGRTLEGVRRKREKLGIPSPADGRVTWTAEQDELVRTLPPGEAAERMGRGRHAVYCRRGVLGVPDGRKG